MLPCTRPRNLCSGRRETSAGKCGACSLADVQGVCSSIRSVCVCVRVCACACVWQGASEVQAMRPCTRSAPRCMWPMCDGRCAPPKQGAVGLGLGRRSCLWASWPLLLQSVLAVGDVMMRASLQQGRKHSARERVQAVHTSTAQGNVFKQCTDRRSSSASHVQAVHRSVCIPCTCGRVLLGSGFLEVGGVGSGVLLGRGLADAGSGPVLGARGLWTLWLLLFYTVAVCGGSGWAT